MSVCVLFHHFWEILPQVTVLMPHKKWRLRAVSPDMAELLAILAMREVSALHASTLIATR
jgi:hypothetical protein